MSALTNKAPELTVAAEAMMLLMQVTHKKEIAHEIVLFRLACVEPQRLPSFSAGSHVVVITPSGLTRRYSLCNGPHERDIFVIAVKRDEYGDGGSISMVDGLQVGDRLSVSHPENYFPLSGDAQSCLLIAGGIGITPILSMAHELLHTNIDFKMIYCCRSPETTAFMSELSAPELAGRVLIHHDHGDTVLSLDLAPLLQAPADGAHLYCCGPRPLMQSIRDLTRHWPSGTVHFEDFGTGRPPAEDEHQDREFSVRLSRMGITVKVPAGMSILEALRRRGITVPSSCESGTCGSCRTVLLSGVADHRDFVLDEDEYDKEIMICVSRAKAAELELDL